MAVPAIIPKLGNTVESCVIVEWKKAVGEAIAEGETLLDVETDKAVMEVLSPASGVVLAQLYSPGDLAPVLETIAVIGAPGEDWSALAPGKADQPAEEPQVQVTAPPEAAAADAAAPSAQTAAAAPLSPRARGLARREGLDATGLAGSGPGGRIIERDVQAALASRPKLSPVAQARLAEGGFIAPKRGSGPG
ncbi:MAG TPA: E3 binding domain-containing protein, partial [Anaerolineae bacterium]|nr:E3 binding domain-containing protein [Anaerolineae bacterium]